MLIRLAQGGLKILQAGSRQFVSELALLKRPSSANFLMPFLSSALVRDSMGTVKLLRGMH